MIKYIAVIDYRANYGKGFDHKELNATNIFDAMNEAEKLKTEEVYMVRIAEKFGKSEKREGAKRTKYREVLANRSGGWHTVDESHSECQYVWERAEYPFCVDYNIV